MERLGILLIAVRRPKPRPSTQGLLGLTDVVLPVAHVALTRTSVGVASLGHTRLATVIDTQRTRCPATRTPLPSKIAGRDVPLGIPLLAEANAPEAEPAPLCQAGHEPTRTPVV